MKSLIITGIVLLVGISGEAMAACSGGYMNGNAVNTLLTGNTVCVPWNGAAGSTFDWQEEHVSGGALWDFKRGTGHPVDPRKQVGNWSVSTTGPTNGKITHSYTGGSPYTYDVKDNGASATPRYSFCGGPTEIFFKVKSGTNVGCP